MKIIATDPLTLELQEWETAAAPDGASLTESDRRLAESLADGERRFVVEELRGGLRLRATSWIGVVRFEHLEIRVVPKLVGGNLGVLEMLDYASGLDALARLRATRGLEVLPDGRLIDLLAQLLAAACEGLLRDGLLQDYVTLDDTLGVLRGRLRIDEQVRRRFGRIDQLECRFDELETNVVENQLLAAALGLARRACRHDGTRRRVARSHSLFVDAADPTAFDPFASNGDIEYTRRNERYRTAHALGWLFLRQLAVHDLYAPGGSRSYAFLLDMNLLFEQFVTRLLEREFAGTDVRVVAQRRDRSLVMNDRTSRPYAAVIPDVILERRDAAGRQRVPVDAKYKLYDEKRLDPADVYQTFFYGYAYARAHEHVAGKAIAYVIYPASSGAEPVQLRVQRADGITAARIRTVAVDVPAALAVIREAGEADLPAFRSVRQSLIPAAAAMLS